MHTPSFTLFDTPVGRCALVWGARGIAGTLLPGASEAATRSRLAMRHAGAREAAPPRDVARIVERILGVLHGGGDDLIDIELDLKGVADFERRVYQCARHIRPGATLSYGALALQLGVPQAARAVGQALGANPFPIIVPCHRVLAAGGRAGGFSASGGARTKLRLLEIERATLGGAPGLFD